jgi:hypothetical protein
VGEAANNNTRREGADEKPAPALTVHSLTAVSENDRRRDENNFPD